MDVIKNTALYAKLIGDPTRANMLIKLMGGRALTATELANSAGVSPQTASSHLAQLLEGELLSIEKQGRHRYYRLASSEVATALEALMSITTKDVEVSERSLEGIYFARTCYDHIAGHVAVKLTDSLLKQGWIEPDKENFELTGEGETKFSKFGIDTEALRKQRRHFARQCLDWTERRHHLAGSLGAALLDSMLERKWIKKDNKADKSGRVLFVTRSGFEGLEKHFDVRL